MEHRKKFSHPPAELTDTKAASSKTAPQSSGKSKVQNGVDDNTDDNVVPCKSQVSVHLLAGVAVSYHGIIVFGRHGRSHSIWWLVWRNGNGVRHINEVKLRPAWLVLGLVTTFGGSTIPYLSRPLSPTQPGRPSLGRCNEYRRWFRPSLGRKRHL